MQDALTKGRLRSGNTSLTSAKGERGPGAKLTNAEVIEMRAAYEAGETQLSIARRFDVNSGTVNRIVHRVRWRHI